MIYDCIPFFNELDILKIRLNILDPYVDRFVIEEATTTFSGQPKELCFEQNKEMFKEFLHKITYIVVDENPADVTTHERDVFQKNHLIEGLKDATDEDIIILSDCDEIPSPQALKWVFDNFDPSKVYHLAQDNFYAFFNMLEVSGTLLGTEGEFPEIPKDKRKWLGTKITSISQIPREGIVRLRDLVATTDPRSIRVPEGGWHFGYMGGHHETNAAKRIGVKVKAAAHQEYNDREILAETLDQLILGRDLLGRDAEFVRVEMDDRYPEYLLNHLAEYSFLVMPKITWVKKVLARLDLTVGRFCRKAYHHILRKIRSAK
ncbi:beta-1,4-mannosyl-glycoprotein beta-1,4-N-acetylglucosaminyltransferase [Butyrivibrio fibrisolvens]|uniref:Beta-1,4-mannosyl-glycoprotein beta-1,4-N-acetylglucosaminyltransferase n=1 Tax=Butyrivibrio fibrisolvens TaxID=831 RepID=A0A1H9Q6V8_BUTFI|nr:glycosyl transferase GT17 family protein [Butyrivibrio fibrisolvens]SER56180.1 beta-1,4-mannosyl-glycoprotein beta-1,4-N-acetylglucosaminyltransferase [Butyrivibrio fibrisolvens]